MYFGRNAAIVRVYSCLNHEYGGDMDDRINSEVKRFQAISGSLCFRLVMEGS